MYQVHLLDHEVPVSGDKVNYADYGVFVFQDHAAVLIPWHRVERVTGPPQG